MKENVTAKFDSLSRAEEAATKLQALRIHEVEISEWGGQQASDAEFASEFVGGYMPNVGQYYPTMGASISAGGYLPMTFAVSDFYQAGSNRQSYILNAVVPPEQLDKARRIISDTGGDEI